MPAGSGITLRNSAEADIPTPDTDQVTIFNDSDLGNTPAYKDDGGTVTSLEGAPGSPGADAPPLVYQDHGNAGSTETVDASAADIHRLVADVATVTLTLTGAPAAGTPAVIRLWLEQDGSGGRIWAFPGSVDWGDPGEPDWTTRGSGAVDLVDLMTVDGGVVWVAAEAGRPGPAGAPGSSDLDTIIAASSGEDIADALAGAAAPDAGNVFATMADVGGGGGAFHGAKVYNAGTQSGTPTVALDFASEEYDTDSYHDTSTNKSRLTVATTGKYLLEGGTAQSSTNSLYLYFRLNGTTVLRGAVQFNGHSIRQVATVTALTASDYVELIVTNVGSETYGHASDPILESWAAITYLGS
jgi:hypothetical protein